MRMIQTFHSDYSVEQVKMLLSSLCEKFSFILQKAESDITCTARFLRLYMFRKRCGWSENIKPFCSRDGMARL